MNSTAFLLHPLPPFRLDLTIWALRRRPNNALDRWDGIAYCRTMDTGGGLLEVDVQQTGPCEAPELMVRLTGSPAGPSSAKDQVAEILGRSLGLAFDLSDFYRLAETDSLLGPLAKRFRGLHPPRFQGAMEALANAVSCQQLSLNVGIGLLNRLTDGYGRGSKDGLRAFPSAEDLAGAEAADLRSLGYSTRKANTLIALARQLAEGELDFDGLAMEDDATVLAHLCALDGIGRWSAEYILLRGFGRLHVFPGDDVGARDKLQRWLSLPEPLDYRGVNRIIRRWSPHAGLVYFHLLLDSLATSGWLPG
ncbi:MAG: DNA-3-methyladenine glycosylase 2 family protein [Candidatus Nephthysia bennettiae]|nr:MAG: DNA-3-methyladenine glycosylase 2 family protein [Candidatus Dormibacteraeota bacterium]